MAPEILRYEKYDAKADLWSVGAVLYEMSVGKPPFRANNHVELLRKIERGEDRIKFPDERSAGSLAREAARREEAGEAPLPPPHHVGEDIKDLIRRLLKRKPVERMSFEEFFRSPVIEAVALGAAKPAEEREHEDESRPQVGASRDAQEGGAPAPPQLAPAPRIASKSEQGERTPNSPISVPTETVLPESGVEPSHPRSEADPREGPSSASGAERSSQSPSPRAGPSPLPTFTSKYVVGGQRPAFAREGSGLNRRGSRQDFGRQPSYEGPGEPSSLEDNVLTTPSSSMTNLHTQPIVAAANDEDSLLGKEYVMIEKRNVEVNALADELAASPQQRNFSLARRPSRLSRLSSGLGSITPSSPLPTSSSTSTSTSEAPVRPGISPPIGPWPVAAPFALPPGSRPSSFPRRTSLSSSGSPSPRLTTQEIGAAPSSSTQKNGSGAQIIGGADEAAQRQVVPASPSSGSPSSALARAISMASVRLFGVPSGMSLRGAAALVRSRSTRRAALIRSGDYPDAAEVCSHPSLCAQFVLLLRSALIS